MQKQFVSIIIPTYNRLKGLANCLRSLTLLDYPRDRLEVIVIDDGSKECPTSLIANYQKFIEIKQSNTG